MPRLRGFNRMCSRTLSDPANRFRKTRKKKSSAVPLFRSGHMSAICARLGSKGKVGVQRGRETAGVPSFLSQPRGAAPFPPSADGESPAECQRKTLRPLGRTCLRSSCAPVNRCRKRVPPRMGEPPARFVHPVKRAPCKSKFPKENPHAIG